MEELVTKVAELGNSVEKRMADEQLAREKAISDLREEMKAGNSVIYKDEVKHEVKNAYWEAVAKKLTGQWIPQMSLKPSADEIKSTDSFKKVEKALATTDGNYFAATAYGVLFEDIVEGNWMSLFPRVPVRGTSMKVPVRSSASGVVLVSENSNDTAQIVAAATVGSRSITLDPSKLGCRIAVTKEAVQDSYLDVMPLMEEQAVRALRDAIQYVMINGDTAGTFDNDVYASNDKRKAFDGFRKLAFTAGKTDGSTFTIADLFDAKKLMGEYAGDNDLLALETWGAYHEVAKLLPGLYTNYADFTLREGQVPKFLGAVHVGTNLVPDTAADSKVSATPGDNVKNSIVLVNPKYFVLGYAQDIEVELEYSAVAQVWNIVVTARVAMGKTGSGQACAHIYNMS